MKERQLRRRLHDWADLAARLSASRWLSAGLIAGIVLIDWLASYASLGFVSGALIDEPCHLATAVIVLGALVRWRGRTPPPVFTAAMLAASVLIDLDHLPAQFGIDVLTINTARPYTHALWLVLVLALVALLAWHRSRSTAAGRAVALARLSAGASAGVAAHFLRDVVTAPISLWWPATDAWVLLPYWWYVVALLALTGVPVGPRRAGRSSGDDGSGSRSGPAAHAGSVA
jgi:hypothetical protein